MRLLFVVSVFFLFIQASVAQTLKLNIPVAGYPPYLLENKEEPGRGIVFDVLTKIAEKQNITIEVVNLPRKRVEKLISIGSVDASLAAIEWIDNPQQFVFTKPIIQSYDALFSTIEKPLSFDTVTDLFEKRIATKLGYKYPLIDDYTAEQKIHRLDALTVKAMLKMVLANRADSTIVNIASGEWTIKKTPQLQQRFFIAKKPINTFKIRLMFNQKWAPFITQFNQELEQLQLSGELATIIQKYR